MTNLEKFRYYMKDLESPTRFIDWNYYFMVSSAIGRKIWMGAEDFRIFPNLYLIFVGPPSVGKSLPAQKATEILLSLQEIVNGAAKQLVNISPDSCTLESLFQHLARSTAAVRLVDGKLYSHSSMSFCLAEELGTLFRQKSEDLVNFLTAGYNCGSFKRTTKHQGEDIISNMCINLLGCCTPEWIRDNVDTHMIGIGFTSRVIFLWGEKPRHRTDMIHITDDQKLALADVKQHIKEIAKIAAPIESTPEAIEWRKDWVKNKQDKHINDDRKLQYYYGRKKIHLYKLAMVIHFSQKKSLVLDVEDYENALRILEDAEVDMHRALASTGNNVLNSIAESIKMTLKLKGPMKSKRILVEHYHLGDEEQQAKSLQYLLNTGQVATYTTNSEIWYRLTEEGEA